MDMTKHIIAALLAASVVAFNLPARAAEKGDPKAQLKEVVDKVREKMKGGKVTAETLAPELKQFDALLAEHQREKTDDVAQILLMKAMLYVQVLDDMEQAKEYETLLRLNDIPAVIKEQSDPSDDGKAVAIMVPEDYLDEAHVVIESQDAYDDLCDFTMDEDEDLDFDADELDDEF